MRPPPRRPRPTLARTLARMQRDRGAPPTLTMPGPMGSAVHERLRVLPTSRLRCGARGAREVTVTCKGVLGG